MRIVAPMRPRASRSGRDRRGDLVGDLRFDHRIVVAPEHGGRYLEGLLDRELAFVDQDVIDALRQREAERGYVIPTEMEVGIEKGRKVRVMAGPLKDMEGVFRGYLRGGQRARVLMEFLRRRSVVEVETELLAVVRA